MELVANQRFLDWAQRHGISRHPKYQEILSFVPEQGESRFWPTPFDLDEKLALLTVALDALDPWRSCWVYKRTGGWTFSEKSKWVTDHSLDVVTRWIGIPEGFVGSVRFDEADRAGLVLMLVIFDLYGSNRTYDLFFVPDHGRQFLWLDHENALWVFFADTARIEPFVLRMSDAGFDLPMEPPPAIAWQEWMGEQPED